MTDALMESYQYCRDIAKKRAGNFYYSFIVLPREKSDAMCAIYAFTRYCDDIADDLTVDLDKSYLLEKWHESLDKTAIGQYEDSRILPAFHHAITRYNIPLEYFHDLINGATMDLSIEKYDTFEQLYGYCYKVASVVGLMCIHIFGFDTPSAKKYAEYCGIAFQLTNILRDIKEDALMGRVYIPNEDLHAFSYSFDDITNGVRDERFHKLMRFEVRRARTYYNAAKPLIPLVHESGRPGLCAMIQIYSGLLDKIERNRYDVFTKRTSLSKRQKLSIAAKTLIKSKINGGRIYQPELQS